jgi:hypothetical protein
VIRFLTMIALWVIAAWHRLRVFDEAIVSSDSLGPYLQAQAALFGHLPRPPNPESGDALWLMAVPLVAATGSLTELFQGRFILGGLVAPIGFAAAYHWTDPEASTARRWAGALASGLFLAFDPGLLDTLVSGARSYGAPELIGVMTLGAALSIRAHPWAPALTLGALIAAAGHHPLALGFGLGLIPLLPAMHQAVGGRRLRQAIMVGALVALPRLIRMGLLANCGEGIATCLSRVAQSNVTEPVSWFTLATTAIHDRGAGDLTWGVWVVLAGLAAVLLCRASAHRKAGQFALAGVLGLLLLGLFTGYIRSYHLRIAAVPFAVAAGIGLARLWPLAIVGAVVFVVQTHHRLPVGPDLGAVARHDRVSGDLPTTALWVDRVWWDGPPTLDPAGVVLSGWLNGRRDFRLGPDVPFILLQVRASAPEGQIIELKDAQDARLWLNAQKELPHQRGGAYDWATISNPQTHLEDARW